MQLLTISHSNKLPSRTTENKENRIQKVVYGCSDNKREIPSVLWKKQRVDEQTHGELYKVVK